MGRSPVAVEAAAGPYRNFTASTMEQNEKSWYCLGYPEQYQLFVVLWKRIRLG